MSLMEEEDAITDVSEDDILGAYFLWFSAKYACVQVIIIIMSHTILSLGTSRIFTSSEEREKY